MNTADRMREAERELLRVAKNLCMTQRIPTLEAAIEEYEAAKETAPNRRLRRMGKSKDQMLAALRRPYP